MIRPRHLLRDLDHLGYSGRTRKLATQARALPPAEAQSLAGELWAMGDPEKRLALLLDPALCLAGLVQPSVGVRRLAARVAARVADPESLADVAVDLDEDTLSRLVGHLRRRERADAARVLVPDLLDAGRGNQASRLVHLCAPARPLLERLEPRRIQWHWLARRQPDLALDLLAEALVDADTPEATALAWRQRRRALPDLARLRPAVLLDLVQRYTPEGLVPAGLTGALGPLLDRDPGGVVEWLIDPERLPHLASAGPPLPLLRRLGTLPDPLAARVGRAWRQSEGHLAAVLRALAPSRREAVFDAALEGLDTSTRLWTEPLLEALPGWTRHREATRSLALRGVAERDRIRITAHLALDEAAPALEALAVTGDAARRGAVLAALVQAAGRSCQGLSGALEHLARLENEQDPVRAAVYAALARVPAARFAAADAPRIGDLVRFAVESRDTSAATRGALFRLAQRLLAHWAREPEHPLVEASLDALLALAGHRGALHLPPLHPDLPRGAETALIDRLLPWLRRVAERDHRHSVVSLAAALGRRAHGHAGLRELLWEATWHQDSHARAGMLLLQDRAERDRLVRRMLDRDRSVVVTLPAVFRHLHDRRQEWLDPFLTGEPPRGAFWSGETWVPRVGKGLHRWLPRQQGALASLLARVIEDDGQPMGQRTAAVRALAAAPITPPETLAALVERPEVPLVEAALGGLVHADRPGVALPLLLGHLQGDRARVAMYALPRLVRLVPRGTLEPHLLALADRPSLKVTVHKEVLRLLGTLDTPASTAAVLAAWDREDLHPDVRVAALHACGRLLHRPGVERVLAEASATEHRDLALGLLQPWPQRVPARHRAAWFLALIDLASHPEVEVRRALLVALAGSGAWLDEEQRTHAAEAARDELLDFTRGEAWSQAATALIAVARGVGPMAVLERAARALVVLASEESAEPRAGRDLAAHQRLHRLATLAACSPATASLRPIQRATARAASALPELLPVSMAALVVSVDWRAASSAAAMLARLAERLPAEEVHLLLSAVEARVRAGAPEEVLDRLADALARSDSARVRALGAVVVRAAGARLGWPPPWRARLVALRGDEAREVRTQAMRAWVFPER